MKLAPGSDQRQNAPGRMVGELRHIRDPSKDKRSLLTAQPVGEHNHGPLFVPVRTFTLPGQLFRVEGKCVLRQVGNGLATKKPIGPCQSVARETRNPLLTSPPSLLRLLPSTIVKQRCARERGANPGKPICGATFSSGRYGPEIFVPYSFPRVD